MQDFILCSEDAKQDIEACISQLKEHGVRCTDDFQRALLMLSILDTVDSSVWTLYEPELCMYGNVSHSIGCMHPNHEPVSAIPNQQQ